MALRISTSVTQLGGTSCRPPFVRSLIALLASCWAGCTPPPPPDPDAADAPDEAETEVAESEAAAESSADTVDDVAETLSDAGADTTDATESSSDAADESDSDAVADALGDAEASGATCGDGVIGAGEECDPPGATDGGRSLCSSTCRVVDLLVVPPPADAGLSPPGRELLEGRHTVAATASGGAVVFVDKASKHVSVLAFGGSDTASAIVQPSVGASPAIAANPVIAASGGENFVAWNDFSIDGDGLGIALRKVGGSSAIAANASKLYAQFDPDLVFVGGELVVAWASNANVARGTDLYVRRFSTSLSPLAGEEELAVTLDAESDVSLAAFGTTYAAAWRAAFGGFESIQVKSGAKAWSLGMFDPGPYGARPALVALDATHLLVAFGKGDGTIGGAVLDTGTTGVVTASTLATGRSPALAVAGGRCFLSYRVDAVLGDPNAEELWLKELPWSASGGLDLTSVAMPLPREAAHRVGDQRHVSLFGVGSALWSTWEDYGKGISGGAGNPDVVVEKMFVPIVRLP